jgi:hypothetical protein
MKSAHSDVVKRGSAVGWGRLGGGVEAPKWCLQTAHGILYNALIAVRSINMILNIGLGRAIGYFVGCVSTLL